MKLANIQATGKNPIANPQVPDTSKGSAKPVSRTSSNEFQRQVNVSNATQTDRSSKANESEVRSKKTLAASEQREPGKGMRGQARGVEISQLADAEAARLAGDKGVGKKGVESNGVGAKRAEVVGEKIPNFSELARTEPASKTNLGDRARNSDNAITNGVSVRGESGKTASLTANGIKVSGGSDSSSRTSSSSSSGAASTGGAQGGRGDSSPQSANPVSTPAANPAPPSNDGTINLQMARGDIARGTEASQALNAPALQTAPMGQGQTIPLLVPIADIASARHLGRTRAEEHSAIDDAAIEQARDAVVEGTEEAQGSTMVAESGAETVEVLWIGEEEAREKKVERGAGDGTEAMETIEELKEEMAILQETGPDNGKNKQGNGQKSARLWHESSNLNEKS